MGFVLSNMERAYELFSSAKDFDGDPILGGRISKWKKATTAFQLKVLMHLSKKESDVDLNVKERFARIVALGSLMESNDDNLQMKYADERILCIFSITQILNTPVMPCFVLLC